MPPHPVLLDCDPGHDDAIAILLAAGRRDAVDLRAVTTVGGNADLGKVTYNARRVMTLAGLRDVPVAAGAAGPLGGDALVTALDVHGESGLDGAPMPEPAMELDPRGAVELMAARGPATVVATGPLTNVALLLERAPEAVRDIVWMGGSTGRGNTRPYAEFNAFVDPEAAAAVFASGVPLTMVGLNLTHQALATPQVVDRLAAIGNEAARTAVGWLGFFADTYRELYGLPGPPVHDPCALAAVIEPELLRSVDAYVAIETEGRHTRGATVVDLHGRLGEPPNARVALELDVVGFWDLVIGAIGRL
jgi:purine nucleosidase/pyrimidine-specific ribonucleoside hydrolase